LDKLGKYELIGELGRGAMGIVYRARDPIINRLVALKTITSSISGNQSLLQRFYREAQSAGGLQHPNIVTIYDMGEASGTPFIAMELVEGQSLEQLIINRPTVPLSLKLAYAMQACRAFDYAHKRGIIHRDIKPANVMLSKDGVVKVVDFGIARIAESSNTQTGLLMGTFAYMSPEQYHGEHADERSDVWSFGILLYELLCYQRPFAGEAPASLMHSICSLEPAPPSTQIPNCPPELDAVMAKALNKSTADRYQTMEDLLLELDPISKSLQTATIGELMEEGERHAKEGEFSRGRDVLRQVLQIEPTNIKARGLLEKINVEIKRLTIRPKAQGFVDKGRTLLSEGKIQDASAEAEKALNLDSNFEPAHELKRLVQRELDRYQLVSDYLESAKLRLAEGAPDEADALLAKAFALEPANTLAKSIQQQVAKERAQRARRLEFLDKMQEARTFWTLQRYEESINLLTSLGREFPQENEVPKLLEAIREDQAEQRRRLIIERARDLLAAGRYEECTAALIDLQREFSNDTEIAGLLQEVQRDQSVQRQQRALGEARKLLSGRQYEECISFVTNCQKQFPNELEFARLLETALADRITQRKQQGISKARKLLTARRYDECNKLLTELHRQFSDDPEITTLIEAVREEEHEQSRLQKLGQTRALIGARQYDEAHRILELLVQEYPDDPDVAYLLETIQSELANQRKLQDLNLARKLLSDRHYDESIALLTQLQSTFKADEDIPKLLEIAKRDRADRLRKIQIDEVRGHVAARRWQQAILLLEPLRGSYAGDRAVEKLWTLVQAEQQKKSQLELYQREFDMVKGLIEEKKYREVIARAENMDFSGDANLMRLLGFARTRQAQIEQETLLQKTCEQARKLLQENRFHEAMQAAVDGLKAFPNKKELLTIREEAEHQEKKRQTRKAIEQRIREIRVNINRENYSDAIDLAKQTLVTMGPDTAVTQLLNSAQAEFDSREKRRVQEKELTSIRLLMQEGKLVEAAEMLSAALAEKRLQEFDPGVKRLSDEIDSARSRASAPPTLLPENEPPLSKEYAWQIGPPVPPQTEEDPLTQTQVAPMASGRGPISSQSVAHHPVEEPVKLEPLPSTFPSEPSGAVNTPSLPSPEGIKPVAWPPAKRVLPTEKKKKAAPPASHPQTTAPPVWKRPVLIIVAAVTVLLFGWLIVKVTPGHNKQIPQLVRKPEKVQPRIPDPLEVQQRQALDDADKARAAGDLLRAKNLLDVAAALNGPLNSEIQQRQAEVVEETKNAELRATRQQEAQLWEKAIADVNRGQFQSGENYFRQIVTIPQGGVKKDEAQRYLDQVIPQRKKEETLYAQARQLSQRADGVSLDRASNNLEQVIQLNGPRANEAQQMLTMVHGKLSNLASQQQRTQEIATLKTSANQSLSAGDLGAARQVIDQIRQRGGDPGTLPDEINRAERQQRQKAEQAKYDDSYQQAVSAYQAAARGDDKSALTSARDKLSPYAQSGAHTTEARKYVSDINAMLAPKPVAVPPAQPIGAKSVTPAPTPNTVLDDEREIRSLITRYQDAFSQRNPDILLTIWPGMGKKYQQYKESFSSAKAVSMRVDYQGPSINASDARVKGIFAYSYTMKGDRPQPPQKGIIVFHLRKTNGAWLIQDVQ
jgi:serine/threonine-protein kinase